MIFNFRSPFLKDLERIMDIEKSGFSSEEAASSESMKERIEVINDSFILAVTESDNPVGYVVGKTVENPAVGGYQTILSLVVDPQFQKFGIATNLLTELEDISRNKKRDGITLTCLKSLIPFYENNGYKLEGVSDSQHAGETWYNMVLDLKKDNCSS